MQARRYRVKLFVETSQTVIEERFNAWAAALPATTTMEGQPPLLFSQALQKFLLSCVYCVPEDG